MKMHKSITVERVTEAVERCMADCENIGFCLACGNEQDGCEPDARQYECDDCGARAVYGAEEIMMMIA